jgi:hypothetical protein
MSDRKEDARVNTESDETLPETRDARQNASDGSTIDSHLLPSHRRITGIYSFALLLSLVLFYFHVMMIFDVFSEGLRYKAWLLEHMGPKHTGKLLLLGCFFVLLFAHVAEAAVWGLFFSRTRLLPSVTEGVYFSAASMTTLGYGDILLKYPWRHLSTLIAITGVLMFGCSTAFLFVVLQAVYEHF